MLCVFPGSCTSCCSLYTSPLNTYKLGYYPLAPPHTRYPDIGGGMQTRGGERGANGAKSVPDHLFYSEQIRNGVGNKCHLWLILIDGKLSKIAH